MSLNDIVVYVDSAEATEARVDFAVALAKDHGAHLRGIAFAPTALLPLYGADVGLADMSEVLEGVKAQGEAALHAFKARAEAEGVSVEGRLMQGMSEEFPATSPARRGMSISPSSVSRATATRCSANMRWSSAACSPRDARSSSCPR